MKKKTERKRTYANLMNQYAAINGLKVVDATHDTKVTVTADHIVRAKKKDSQNCAFAEACKASPTLKPEMAFFTRGVGYIHRGNKLVRYILNERATREIVSFDRSKIMEPGVYTLRAPSLSRKSGARNRKPTGPHRKKGKRITVQSAMVRRADDVEISALLGAGK